MCVFKYIYIHVLRCCSRCSSQLMLDVVVWIGDGDGRDDERWKLDENVGDRTHKIATSVPCALYSPNGFIVMPVCCWRPGKCIRCRYFLKQLRHVPRALFSEFVHK